MFAKLARFHGSDRLHATLSKATPCNDNQPARRRLALSRRMRRPVLGCRWHQTPAGRLECSWHVEQIATVSTEEQSLRRSLRRRRTVAQPVRHGRNADVTVEHIAKCSLGCRL